MLFKKHMDEIKLLRWANQSLGEQIEQSLRAIDNDMTLKNL